MKQIREVLVKELVIYFYVQLLVLAAIWATFGVIVGLDLLSMPLWAEIVIALCLSYMPLRCLAIGCILMYKAYAPMRVRNQCRFNPTCSTYMLIAIKKYGLIIGIFKGVRRICRCKPPNGGDDWP